MNVIQGVCFGCRGRGLKFCACNYMREELRPGLRVTEIAVAMFKYPLPVVGGLSTYHFDGCPCPRCYDLRSQSWDLGAIPSAPRRESWSELARFDAPVSEAENV